MIAIVDAVPIVLHAPSPRPRHVSSRAQAADGDTPARRWSYSRHSAGMSALASAIR
jgi:hypothetical protein